MKTLILPATVFAALFAFLSPGPSRAASPPQPQDLLMEWKLPCSFSYKGKTESKPSIPEYLCRYILKTNPEDMANFNRAKSLPEQERLLEKYLAPAQTSFQEYLNLVSESARWKNSQNAQPEAARQKLKNLISKLGAEPFGQYKPSLIEERIRQLERRDSRQTSQSLEKTDSALKAAPVRGAREIARAAPGDSAGRISRFYGEAARGSQDPSGPGVSALSAGPGSGRPLGLKPSGRRSPYAHPRIEVPAPRQAGRQKPGLGARIGTGYQDFKERMSLKIETAREKALDKVEGLIGLSPEEREAAAVWGRNGALLGLPLGVIASAGPSVALCAPSAVLGPLAYATCAGAGVGAGAVTGAAAGGSVGAAAGIAKTRYLGKK